MKKSYQDIFQKYFIHGVNIMMIILGCIGLMKNYYHSLFFPSDTLMSIVLLIFSGIGFYCLYLKYDQMPLKLFLKIFLGLFLVMLILSQNELRYFVSSLKEVIVNDYFLNISELVPDWMSLRSIFYQLIILWLGLPVVYLIVSALCSSHLALLKTIFMIILFVFPLLIKHTLSSIESYCFIIYIGYQFLSAVILKNQRQHYVLKMIMVCFLCAVTFIASSYMESNPVFHQSSSSFLSQLLDSAFNNKSNPLGIVTQTGMSSDIDGTLPTGNIRLNKNVALTIQAETPFSSYLRAYSLANYQDSQWHEVNEDYQYNQSLTLYSDFLRLNHTSSVQTVKIVPEQNYDFQFIPYYFTGYVNQDISYSLVYDSYVEANDEDLVVIYDHEEKVRSSLSQSSYIISGQYDEQYENYVYENYMDVPEELYDQLKDLMIEYGVWSSRLSVDETIQQVQQLLSRHDQYDLNAGTLPASQDFVEYFLFENKKGSCTHFATAGALMLRQKGIPTRFVRGYIMKASDFHEGKASIPQYRSHAWIEVYKDDMGWVPYEMTPSGNMETLSDRLDQSANQSQENTTVDDSSTVSQPSHNTPSTANEPLSDEESVSSYQYVEPLIAIFIIIVLLMIYRYLTTHWLQIKTKHMTYKQKLLLYYQVIWKLSPQHHIDEGYLKDMAYKAKYSLHEITENEWKQFYDCYVQWLDHYDQSLKWYQRFIFRYVKGYK